MGESLLKLKPKLVPRVWGGNRLAKAFGVRSEQPIGEAWMIYDENEIAEGPYAGRRLKEVLPELGEAFLGKRVVERYGYELPLLIKFLDTAEWLSVQVHPDDAYAHSVEAHTGFHGKNEAWVILDAEPGAEIIYGVKRPVTREELKAAALDGSILDLLNFVPVQPGDVIYIPAGTIHALGPGLLVYEVQQRSDLTYRLFDYGRGRELHVEKALEVAHLAPQPLEKTRLSPGHFLSTPTFSLAFVKGSAQAGEDTFLALTCISCEGFGFLLGVNAKASLNEGGWFVVVPH